MFAAIRAHILPCLLGWNVAMLLSRFSTLSVRSSPDVVVSNRGILRALWSESRQRFLIFYSMCGTWTMEPFVVHSEISLPLVYNVIESIGPSCGLHLNCSKWLLQSPVITPLSYNPLLLEVPVVSGGLTLLGSPIGPFVFHEDQVCAHAGESN